MGRLRRGRPAPVLATLLAALAVAPSLRWCQYAWDQVPIECLLGAPTCAAPPVGEAAGAECCDGPCAACPRSTNGHRDGEDRAWCPGGPLGGNGLETRAAPHAIPVLQPVPLALIPPPELPAFHRAPRPRVRPPSRAAPPPPPIRGPPSVA